MYHSINTSPILKIPTYHIHQTYYRYEIATLLPTYAAVILLKIPFVSAVCFSGPPTMTKMLSNRHAIVEFPLSKAWVGCRVVVIQDTGVKSLHYTVHVATVVPMAIVSGSFSCCFVLFRVVSQCFVHKTNVSPRWIRFNYGASCITYRYVQAVPVLGTVNHGGHKVRHNIIFSIHFGYN